MIRNLSINFQKPVAWLLFMVFYLQLAVPLVMQASPITYNYSHSYIASFHQDFTPAKDYEPTAQEFIQGSIGNSLIKAPLTALHTPEKKLQLPIDGPGPGQPEMQSFQSVNTSNMVDLFSGDFSYNIPLLDIGGYPVNIHYTGGISMDQEASWVGLGWNINPGTISRNMRGIPDDFNGQDSIARTQHVKPNKTAGVTVGGDFELFGGPLRVGASLGVFNNNYNGFGLETGINASINSGAKGDGPFTGGLSLTNNSQTGLNVNPSLSVSLGKADQDINGRASLSTNYNTRTGISALQLNTEVRSDCSDKANESNLAKAAVNGIPISASISFAVPSYTPTISMPYTSTQYAFTVKIGSEHWGGHPSLYANGYVSQQEIKPADEHQSLPAFGYLYYSLSNNQPNALLDVNREKETQFNVSTSPMIAIPQYTYDSYCINAEGTGGSFRPYRGEIGYVKDHAMRTKSSNYSGSVDLGFGTYFHIGADFTPVTANTQTHGWENPGTNSINSYIHFQKSDSTFQEVYFRNPGEKTSNSEAYYHSVGDDNLMRIKLGGDKSNIAALNAFTLVKNTKPVGEIAVNTPPVKTQRDKRTQVITYLTAQEASWYGLDKTMKSYKENTIPLGNCNDTFTILPRIDAIHKKHHLSEIDVTNADGRRYVYGLPAYNVEQKDVTFSAAKETDPGNINNGLVSYLPAGIYNNTYYRGDNSTGNVEGKDNYYTQDSMPGYAHDFLLTGVLSPDYVDITGDGITPDDIGDAVKFNYSRVYGPGNYYQWRTPVQENTANYNEGLKTYSRDDKGTYLYGKKEVWYLNSLESKTMIAVFKIKDDRLDSKEVKGENGGYDNSNGLRRLDEIDLYAKADLIANPTSAKPIKAVHFAYSYQLCKGIDPSIPASAKLTLDSIWFSYNNNYKGRVNPYVFHYSPDADGHPQAQSNPAYNPKNYDRWGNFKDPQSNPGSLSNVDYPYSVQDSATAAQYATAWQLTDIKLPSSGKLKITYEADDYAYVQNRRASQLFQIAGFGSDPLSTPSGSIYNSGSSDNYYLFVNTDVALTDTADLRRKFLGNSDTVYFKVAIQMPTDMWGSGNEMVSGYGVVAGIGISAGNSGQFWLRLQAIKGESPVTRSALQFLRLNLPSKAYPGSEVGNDISFSTAITMLTSGFKEIKNAINGFDKEARIKSWCQLADVSKSFVRLTNPNYKKYGGGYRVKRVELFDNWNKMTGQKEASYGQEYSYTTTEEEGGIPTTISSGVASYEPSIGNEENPFHEPIEYAEKLAPLAPVSYLFVEEPVCESFYPSASVGYSKVVVRTINRKAKSANGWDETTFYTTKDFPTLVDYTVLDDYSKKRYNPKLSALLKINAKNFMTLSQGFKVELNDMNGKMKSQASYPETDSVHPIKASYYYYKEDNTNAFRKHLNNTVPIVDSLSGHINPNGMIGKDIEVMVDLREQSSKTVSRQFSPNVDIIPFFWFPLPVPSFWPLPQIENTKFRSASTVKIVQRYGILDSVVVIDKGSVVSTKNLVYDGETGDVIVSRTNNEFNDPVYNFNYPAYWAYSGMGLAYQNIGTVFYKKNIMSVNGKLFNAVDQSDFPVKRYFESGDELWVHSDGSMPYDPNCAVLNPDLSKKSTRLWVMDAAKGLEKDRGLYFIDAAGVPYTGVIDSLKIIRSGKRNMPEASAGSIVSLANPMREVTTGNFKIVIDAATQVIHTAATAYKDFWKVENTLYQKDTVITVYDTTTVYPLLTATTFRRYRRAGNDRNYEITPVTQPSNDIGSSFQHQPSESCGGGGTKSIEMYSKSALSFDSIYIPPGITIINASLNLSPRIPIDFWQHMGRIKIGCLGRHFYPYDWSSATNYYMGTPSPIASLKRIEDAWNTNTPYISFNTSGLNSASVTSDQYQQLNVTSLIQDMVTYDTKNGIMFELNPQSTDGNLYYLNFCAYKEQDVNNVLGSNCGYLSLNKIATSYLAGPAIDNVNNNNGNGISNIPCDCQKPVLTITYRYPVDTTIKVCRNNISDTATNPYRWGMLGNWRVDRAYSYYSDRNESNASITETNIRKEGTLKSFTPFWKMTDSVLLPNPDTTKWVWNSALSLYNRKGFEIENYDPLGRYNSGLYGYNETLPVAVAQNSKYRQMLFDGFEDYSYKAANCVLCPSPREFDFITGNSNASVSNVQSHTGLYSLKVNSGFQSVIKIPVSADTLASSIQFKIDSSAIYTTMVTGKGTGISGDYYGYTGGQNTCGLDINFPRLDTTINFAWGANNPGNFPVCSSNYTVTWNGFIQAPSTGNFIFTGFSDYIISLKINNQTLFVGPSGIGEITLSGGSLYPITVQYTYNNSSQSFVQLYWSSATMPQQIVPKLFLYPQNISSADTTGSLVKTLKKWCTNASYITQQNMVRPVFSPIQGDHAILSAWVRIDAPDCNTLPALSNVINVNFNTGGNSVSLQKTGVRIEGWQRYESEVFVPPHATSMNIIIAAPSTNNIFLDDIKMQPFNSSMKGFIYNPVNLRLMAELDENNYASFYEYDDDGTLIRVKKETERGIMTIQETRSALNKDD